MKLLAWLKKIYLFPFMLMMNIEGQDAAAGAAGDAAGATGADQSGTQGEGADEGAEAQDDDLDPDADPDDEGDADESTDQEAADKLAAEEEAKKGIVQKTLDERVAELAQKEIDKALAKFKEDQDKINKETEERLAAEKKPFVEMTPAQSAQLNADYTAATVRKLELAEQIRLETDPAAQAAAVVELRNVETWIKNTETWYANNEAAKAKWTSENAEREKQTAAAKERVTRLITTADVFRQQMNIPQDAWDAGSVWFANQMKENKILKQEFDDAYRLHGDVACVKFAHDYITKNMGKDAQSALEQKLNAKEKLPPGGGAGAATSTSETVLKGLRGLHAKAQASGEEADFTRFAAAKRKAGITGSIYAKSKAQKA
jgi:hypothetical protein